MANTTPPSPVNANTASSAAATAAAAQPFQTASLYVGDIHPDVTEVLLLTISALYRISD